MTKLKKVKFLFVIASLDGKNENDNKDAFNRFLDPVKNTMKKTILTFLKNHIDPLFFTLTRYHSNSDTLELQVRCTPRYTVDMWDNDPSDVWYNQYKGKPNYFMCNINRLLFLFQICNLSL